MQGNLPLQTHGCLRISLRESNTSSICCLRASLRESEIFCTELRVPSAKFLLNYLQIYLFMKITSFGKCSHFKILCIIGYSNISWRPQTPTPKSGGHEPPTPSGLMPMNSRKCVNHSSMLSPK